MTTIRTINAMNNITRVETKRILKILHNLQKQGKSRKIDFFKRHQKKFTTTDNDNFIPQLESIINVLNRNFDDKWDFYLNTDYTRYTEYNTKLELSIIIHYPEITITNSEDLEHTIKDLIAVIDLFTYSYNMLAPVDIKGFRTTLSEKEFINRYTHSHLPKRPFNKENIFATDPFCIGEETELKNLMGMLKDRENKDNYEDLFEAFIYNLQSMLEWESLEGVPYNHMNKLKDNIELTSICYLNFTQVSNFGNRIIKYIETHPDLIDQIEFLYDNGLFKIKNDNKFKKLIRKAVVVKDTAFENTFLYEDLHSVLITKQNGELLTINPNYQPIDFSAEYIDNPEFAVLINGKELKFIVEKTQEEDDKTTSLDNFFINPSILKYVEFKLNKQLQYAIIKENHSQRKSKRISA